MASSSIPTGSRPSTDSTEAEEQPTEARLTAAGRLYPQRVPWDQLGPDFLEAWGRPNGQWQPEHLEILGPTGSGKSFFEKHILEERAKLRGSHVVILLTKPADKTIKALDWPVVTKWPPSQWKKENAQVVYHAKSRGLGRAALEGQREAVEELLDGLWHEDANTILAVDEIAYVEQELGLRAHMTTYLREGRTLGITVVASTQRPAGVSRAVHSESAWCVFFAPKDEDDADRMAQIAGDKKHYREVLQDLDREKREFLLIHNLTREAYISHIPPQNPSKKRAAAPRSDVQKREPGTRPRAARIS